jgi:hypothetical protein
MKIYFLILCFTFKVKFFELIPNGKCIIMQEHKITNILYIVCNMGFKSKSFGLNILIIP